MSAKVTIPGLSFVPIDEKETGEGIQIPTFTGITRVPESHRYGRCRPREDFDKLGTICDGNFATVYKCRDKRNGEVFALKKFNFTPEMLKNGIPTSFLREINVLQILKHENIVNSHGTIAGKKLESNFLLLDYCTTSLYELIVKKCPAIYERDVEKYLMRQLFDGLSYMHQCLMVHRNISCRNLLFNEYGILKISGFRTARFYDKEGMTPAVTELAYRAPELLFKVNRYGAPADVWSAGCVFAELLLKKPLFSGDSELAVLKSIFSVLGTPSENIWPGFDLILNNGSMDEKIITNPQPFSDIKNILAGVPDSSSKLLQDLIIYYPLARLTASEVLKSPYMTEAPVECSSTKMVSILEKALSISQLLEVPAQMDS